MNVLDNTCYNNTYYYLVHIQKSITVYTSHAHVVLPNVHTMSLFTTILHEICKANHNYV